MLIRCISTACCLLLLSQKVTCHSCGNNKIPYGIEVHKNGQPSILCSKPTCFQKTYADCDERPIRDSCPSNNTWIGGFEKSYGLHQPLYLQCCEFENLDNISDLVYTNVIVRPGEYFEGEEITFTENSKEKVVAFDFISNLRMIKEGPANKKKPAFVIDVRRFHSLQNSKAQCHRNCYLTFVSHISPVHIDGLVSIHIQFPKRRRHRRRYLSDMEAFQNTCWTYRDYLFQCFNQCGNLSSRSLFSNFFNNLMEYCIRSYESIVRNWGCLQNMKKYRHLCDRECTGTCDKTCLYFCHHPIATRVCEGPDPIGFLLNVSSVISPRSRRALQDPLCYDEVIKYNRLRTRVN